MSRKSEMLPTPQEQAVPQPEKTPVPRDLIELPKGLMEQFDEDSEGIKEAMEAVKNDRMIDDHIALAERAERQAEIAGAQIPLMRIPYHEAKDILEKLRDYEIHLEEAKRVSLERPELQQKLHRVSKERNAIIVSLKKVREQIDRVNGMLASIHAKQRTAKSAERLDDAFDAQLEYADLGFKIADINRNLPKLKHDERTLAEDELQIRAEELEERLEQFRNLSEAEANLPVNKARSETAAKTLRNLRDTLRALFKADKEEIKRLKLPHGFTDEQIAGLKRGFDDTFERDLAVAEQAKLGKIYEEHTNKLALEELARQGEIARATHKAGYKGRHDRTTVTDETIEKAFQEPEDIVSEADIRTIDGVPVNEQPIEVTEEDIRSIDGVPVGKKETLLAIPGNIEATQAKHDEVHRYVSGVLAELARGPSYGERGTFDEYLIDLSKLNEELRERLDALQHGTQYDGIMQEKELIADAMHQIEDARRKIHNFNFIPTEEEKNEAFQDAKLQKKLRIQNVLAKLDGLLEKSGMKDPEASMLAEGNAFVRGINRLMGRGPKVDDKKLEKILDQVKDIEEEFIGFFDRPRFQQEQRNLSRLRNLENTKDPLKLRKALLKELERLELAPPVSRSKDLGETNETVDTTPESTTGYIDKIAQTGKEMVQTFKEIPSESEVDYVLQEEFERSPEGQRAMAEVTSNEEIKEAEANGIKNAKKIALKLYENFNDLSFFPSFYVKSLGELNRFLKDKKTKKDLLTVTKNRGKQMADYVSRYETAQRVFTQMNDEVITQHGLLFKDIVKINDAAAKDIEKLKQDPDYQKEMKKRQKKGKERKLDIAA